MLRDNPVRTAMPLLAVTVWFGQALSDYLIGLAVAAMPADAAAQLGMPLTALSLTVFTGAAYQVGALVQRHLTEPKDLTANLIAKLMADEHARAGMSDYVNGRVDELSGDDPFGDGVQP